MKKIWDEEKLLMKNINYGMKTDVRIYIRQGKLTTRNEIDDCFNS